MLTAFASPGDVCSRRLTHACIAVCPRCIRYWCYANAFIGLPRRVAVATCSESAVETCASIRRKRARTSARKKHARRPTKSSLKSVVISEMQRYPDSVDRQTTCGSCVCKQSAIDTTPRLRGTLHLARARARAEAEELPAR